VGVRVVALECGWVTAPAGLFLAGAPGTLRVPVPAFLVEHPRGLVLFDTGLHPSLRTDPAARLGRLAEVFTVELGADGDVASRLAATGVDPASIRCVVASHLHFDHTGGLETIPGATLVVQRREWDAGADPDLRAANAYDPADYDLGHALCLVDGEHDLFGDGRVVCLPTFGHTPGHQSLRVRSDDGDVVLSADACYLRETLETLRLPAVVHDAPAMRRSLERLRALGAAGARIVFGHDPEQWMGLPRAPAALTQRPRP
jgi:glyoxylase-like metal-dependent hydrolase (beta-lactamase superfamily II)